MRFPLFPVTLALLGATNSAVAAADVVKPTTAAVASYQQGQAYERLFQDINLAPGTCAIVLERERCNADLQLLSAMRGQDPTDALARKWFATGDISMRVEKWNDMYVPDRHGQTIPSSLGGIPLALRRLRQAFRKARA